MSGAAVEIGWLGLAGAAGLVTVNALASLWLGLGLERRLAVASLRTVVQLLLLGWVLLPVFSLGQPLLVIALAVVMVAIAAREALRRSSRRYQGDWLGTFGALAVSALATTWLGTGVLIGVDPWWRAQYLIPMLGMVLGNGLNGVSLGVDACLRGLDDGRELVEARLALGATHWEAARPVVREAVRAGMIPILNTMSVVGIVSIPGMMTGQILGGTSPELAARYQILILFMIAAATAAGCVGSVLLAIRSMFDDRHRLRLDRLRRTR